MKINGERHYLWRAVDHEGEVLESYVTKKRDKKAALKFMKKAMRRYGSPNKIVTDRLRSYSAAAKELGCLDKLIAPPLKRRILPDRSFVTSTGHIAC